MSEPDPRLSASPAPRRLALTVLMVVAGIVLLLPGLCSLVFIAVLASDSLAGLFDDPGLLGLWAGCFAISAGGILLIRHAWRGRSAR